MMMALIKEAIMSSTRPISDAERVYASKEKLCFTLFNECMKKQVLYSESWGMESRGAMPEDCMPGLNACLKSAVKK
jgi:hypothetical protein